MILLLLSTCVKPTPPASPWTDAERAVILSLSPLPAKAPSPNNAVADSPAAAALGERLFHDASLSKDGKTPCAECHFPDRHFTEDEEVAVALGTGTRNTPTVELTAWQPWFFWDGRADSGWAQATGPLLNPIEMGMTAEAIQARVRQGYTPEFEAVFGGVDPDPTGTLVQVGKAIEAFERTKSPGEGRFDRYVAELRSGNDGDVLTEQEKQGLRLFVGQAGCVRCHTGPLLTDFAFHDIGLPGKDEGREAGVAKLRADPLNCRSPHAAPNVGCEKLPDGDVSSSRGAFKTPSLRNVAVTSPYMHDGQMDSIGEILNYYDTLPPAAGAGARDPLLQPLAMRPEQLAAIEAFLGTLTAE